jgi:hypothetical protein
MSRARSFLVVLSLAAGCSTIEQPTPDGRLDGSAVRSIPVGARCEAGDLLCADGIGVCVSDICRGFCSAVQFPLCPSGSQPKEQTRGDAAVCVCVPHDMSDVPQGRDRD